MDIGTAKITNEEMQGIKHYQLDIVDPGEDYSVGDFEIQVNSILKDKEKNQENILLVGGTGLYIKAITDGFSNLPSKDEKVRNELEGKTLEELRKMLEKLDEKAYGEIDICNKLRLVRAIEVCILTGGKFSELKNENVKNNNYSFMKVFLTRNREEIYDRINRRVDIMISQGLEAEARKIYDKYENLRYKIASIGYKEFFKYFDGENSLDETIEEIKRESRRYAKRQMTWFRKEKDYIIYNLSEQNENDVMKDIIERWNKF
jgi:tRNA dimethylallyltransferase